MHKTLERGKYIAEGKRQKPTFDSKMSKNRSIKMDKTSFETHTKDNWKKSTNASKQKKTQTNFSKISEHSNFQEKK